MGRSRRAAATAAIPARAVRAVGRNPPPFHQFIVKIASRCNLSCDYCYVYEGQDQSWRTRPHVMSPATVQATADRIGEHARAHALSTAHVVFHGGEPLLAGPAVLESAMTVLRGSMPPGTDLRFTIQTNGLLLNEEFLQLFARYQVSVGISIDGNAAAQDRHRRRADGRSSHADVLRGLRLLTAWPGRTLLAGLLSTIDLANDPIVTYQALAAFGPPSVDFLLPLANWSQPPPGTDQGNATPYADWLLAIFDHWYESPPAVSVRLFDEIISLLLGGKPTTEIIGGAPLGFAVIETDGNIESADTLKFAYPDAARTGMSVFDNSFNDMACHPAVVAQRLGIVGLCATCGSCPVVGVCGGGHYAHRYLAGNGFVNPSVYCRDLYRVIEHIGRRVLTDLAAMRAAKP
jgi:uncharacterized protein